MSDIVIPIVFPDYKITVNPPFIIDPRPNSYIEEIRDDFTKLDYDKKANTLVVEGSPLSDSKRTQQAAS